MDGTRDQLDQAICREVGAEVHRLRSDRGWSLAELSTKAHYSVGHLSKIENGKKRVTPEMARAFDEAFGTGGVLTGLLATPEEPTPLTDEPESADVGPCPYPGLAPFGREEARWFFGRAPVTADLVRRLDERLGGGGPLAVVAPSGAGKSSLLAAGLIPALARGALPGSGDWLIVTTTPSAHPLSTLATRIAERSGTDPATAAAAARHPDRFAAFLADAATDGENRETPSSTRIVLIVDQFEEIFTECREGTERHAFIAALSAAAQSETTLVVLGVRADFYGSCLAYPALLTALQAPVALGPMSVQQLREIITGPARAEDLHVEPGLVELLLRDLGITDDPGTEAASYDPGALPLLAHALRATWQLRSDRTLTVAGYQRAGGIRQALASTAERAYARLNPAEQRLAQQVLLRLVNVRDHGSDTRHRLPRTRLIESLPAPAETIEKVLEVLGRARLVTLGADREAGVEITHEALLQAWPRLAGWISADRAGLRTHQKLSEAADAWEQAGRDPSGLYRGTRLAVARTWATTPGRNDQLSALEDAYLSASIDQERREQQAEWRRTRRLRQLLAALAVLLVVSLGTSVVAAIEGRNAVHQRDMALSREVADEASKAGSSDVSLAMQLSLAAYRIAHTTEALSALLSASTLHTATRELADTESLYAVAISPDGRTLAVGSADQAVRLYDLANPRAPTFVSILTDHIGTVLAVAFSPDGHTLASASNDHTVRLWDVSNPHHPTTAATLTDHTGAVNTVTFSRDGHTLATGSNDNTVRLWDVSNPHHPTTAATLTGLTGPVSAVAFSPDGHTLATSDNSRTVRLWDMRDPHHPTPAGTLTGYQGAVNAVAFSRDGHTLATGSDDTTVRLWNPTDPYHPVAVATLDGHTASVESVAFSPDGHTLASASNDRTVRIWDLTSPQRPPTVLTGHTGNVNGVAFSPNGHTLASASWDDQVMLWDMDDPHYPPQATITDLTDPAYTGSSTIWPFYGAAFSPDGHVLAVGVNDDMVRLWNLSDPHHPTPEVPLTGHTGPVYDVAFSHDGHTLATAGNDHTVRLWNLTDPQRPSTVLTGHTDTVSAVTFSPNGHALASGSRDDTVRLWDLTDPRYSSTILRGHTKNVEDVKFSPDGHTLATASDDDTVRLWDLTDPHHPTKATLTGHTGGVNAVAFSPDGHTLALGGADGMVKLWDLTDLQHPSAILTGHTSGVTKLAFSPDGHTLASASFDNTARLWDLTNSQHASAILTGHTNTVDAVAFSRDGRSLVTTGYDGVVRLWDTSPDQAATDICALVRTPITTAQWQQYIPDQTYNPPCK
ncbi:MAG: helix-turn-helix domain-containing protein [Pseudonocardiaceae bacterium]